MTFYNRIIRQFLNCIHGVISTDIDKRLNVKFVKDIENLVINIRILMNLRQFVAA